MGGGSRYFPVLWADTQKVSEGRHCTKQRHELKSTHEHGLRDVSDPWRGGAVVQDGKGDGMGCEL